MPPPSLEEISLKNETFGESDLIEVKKFFLVQTGNEWSLVSYQGNEPADHEKIASVVTGEGGIEGTRIGSEGEQVPHEKLLSL